MGRSLQSLERWLGRWLGRWFTPLVIGLVATALAAPPVAADDRSDDVITAKDRFYDRGISVDRDGDRDDDGSWAGLRTSFLLRRSGDDGCRFLEVSERTVFRNGDEFRVRLQANTGGHLYLVLDESGGDVKLLYPQDPDLDSSRLRRYRQRAIPEDGWFRFDRETGVERLYVFYSRRPIEGLEAVLDGDRTLSRRSLDQLVADTMSYDSQTLVERGDEDQTGGEIAASYHVERWHRDREVLVRRFDLIHRASR